MYVLFFDLPFLLVAFIDRIYIYTIFSSGIFWSHYFERCASPTRSQGDQVGYPPFGATKKSGWWFFATPLKKYEFVNKGMMTETQYFWENAKLMATKPPTHIVTISYPSGYPSCEKQPMAFQWLRNPQWFRILCWMTVPHPPVPQFHRPSIVRTDIEFSCERDL